MNKEQLTEAIIAIDPDAEVADKTHADLVEMLASLQPATPPPAPGVDADDSAADANPDDGAVDALRAKADAAVSRADKAAAALDDERSKYPYQVAAGQGITSLRGILADGDPVSARDFKDGEVTLKYFLDLGCIVKN